MLWQELKKIWRPGMVLMILVLGFVFYAMYLEGNITYFPADAYGDGELRVAADWMDRYGTTISPEEMAEIEANVSGLLREADEAIAANRLAQMIGLIGKITRITWIPGIILPPEPWRGRRGSDIRNAVS